MIKKIIELIFGSEKQKIKKKIDKNYQKAIEFQRNGNIRMYSVLMNEIANLEDTYNSLE